MMMILFETIMITLTSGILLMDTIRLVIELVTLVIQANKGKKR